LILVKCTKEVIQSKRVESPHSKVLSTAWPHTWTPCAISFEHGTPQHWKTKYMAIVGNSRVSRQIGPARQTT
jgi:hypothetical protein